MMNDTFDKCIILKIVELHDPNQDTKHYSHWRVSNKPSTNDLTDYWDFGGKFVYIGSKSYGKLWKLIYSYYFK